MLSVWKRTWKEKDPPTNSKQDKLDGPGSSAPTQGFTAAAHPSEISSSASLPPVNAGFKRLCSETDSLSEPPAKRLRIDAIETLPDVDRDMVMEEAKQKNTIVILALEQAITTVVQFLKWSIDVERLRFNPVIKRHRTALLVVNVGSSFETYGASIHSVDPDLLVGKYDVVGGSAEAEPWAHFLQQDVVIVTSNLLLESLIRGTLAMTQLHALIFSDLQNDHSQLRAPILQIMNNFYLVTDPLSRPRILGFAPDLAGSGVYAGPAITKIEAAMDAKVLDLTSEGRMGAPSPICHNEVVLLYDRATQLAASTLLKELHLLDPAEALFQRHFEDSQNALDEIGPCASDLVWRRALKEIDSHQHAEEGTEGKSVSAVHRMRDSIKNWTFVMPNLDPSSQGFNVSHKFLMLVKALESCEPYGEAFRGIIYVRQPTIAIPVADLLRKVDDQLSFLRPVALPGNGLRQQEILHGFIVGVYNLLITPEPNKDTDMPKASVIICFDDFASLTGSRTFGREHETHLIHIVEKIHDSNTVIPLQISYPNHGVLPPTGSICDGSQVSAISLTSYSVNAHLDIEDSRDGRMYIQDPTTSRRIYIQNSVEAVDRIALSDLAAEQILFHFEEQREWPSSTWTLTCTVILPGLRKVTGPPCTSKDDAKRAACYKLCEDLAVMGLLDYHIFPPPRKLVTHIANEFGRSSDDPKAAGTRSYIRKDPDFWINTRNTPIASLYPVIISTTHTDEDMQPYAPLVILTRQPLPDLTSFEVFYSGAPAVIEVKRGAALQLEETQLHDLYLYTLRMCRVISNKPLECTFANMVYFLAPLTCRTFPKDIAFDSLLGLPSIAEYIPWDLVNLAGNSYVTPLMTATLEEAKKDIQDAVIQDRAVEFTRRYAAIRMRPDLSPLSKPLDSPREAAYDNIITFWKARRPFGFEGLRDENQPLIEVSTIPPVLNQLNPTSRLSLSTEFHAKYLIPELCSKSTIPASALRTGRLLPSITRRIDDLLLVKELNAKLFDHAISDKLLHMALCTPSCGVEYDYERLELLGDAFLKYVSSIYLFVAHPADTEGALHLARQELISNKSLRQHACHNGLPAYIQSQLFSPKQWLPPYFTLPDAKDRADESWFYVPKDDSGDVAASTDSIQASAQQQANSAMELSAPEQKQKNKSKQRKKKKKKKRGSDDNVQWLGDKAVADVAEAIIGAGYITGGQDMGLKVVIALGIPISDIQTWSDFGKTVVVSPPNFRSKLKPESVEAVEDIIGHKIEQPHLLAQALTHSSIQDHASIISERLEFLGDAILDFVVIRNLYDREQQLTPGGLTLLKGAMVSNSALAAVCVCSGLHEHLVHKSHALQTSIQDYVTKLKASQAKEYRNAEIEGRPPGQFWLELAAPKVLGDIVESIAGAVYIADRFSPVGVETLFNKLLKPFYEKHITLRTLSHHPTKLLFELFQRQKCRLYKTSNEMKERRTTIVNIIVHEVVLASAEDPDPNIAARRASLFALDALEGDPGFFARTCDCRIPKPTEEKAANKKTAKLAVEEQANSAVDDVAHSEDSELEEGMILE